MFGSIPIWNFSKDMCAGTDATGSATRLPAIGTDSECESAEGGAYR